LPPPDPSSRQKRFTGSSRSSLCRNRHTQPVESNLTINGADPSPDMLPAHGGSSAARPVAPTHLSGT